MEPVFGCKVYAFATPSQLFCQENSWLKPIHVHKCLLPTELCWCTHHHRLGNSRQRKRGVKDDLTWNFSWFSFYVHMIRPISPQIPVMHNYFELWISMSYIIQLKRGGLMPRVTLSRNRRPGYKGRILHIALQLATSSRRPSRSEMSAGEWKMPDGHPDFLNNDPMCYVL